MAYLLNSFSIYILMVAILIPGAACAAMPGASYEETGAAKAASEQKAILEKQAQFGIFPTAVPKAEPTSIPRVVRPGNAREVDLRVPDYSGGYDTNYDADEDSDGSDGESGEVTGTRPAAPAATPSKKK